MELASYLAGERWSDRPACTHPLLAALARLVNDHTSDAARPALAPLVPAVIGLTPRDPRVDVHIALRSAVTALPVVAAERQRVLAVSILAAQRALADLDGSVDPRTAAEAGDALASAPNAAAWARAFTEGVRGKTRRFGRHAAPSTVRYSVVGIAQACVPDPDARLRLLLEGAIADCAALVDRCTTGPHTPGHAPVDDDRWVAACRLTGVSPDTRPVPAG